MPKPRSELFGLQDKQIARACRVSLKTAQRWKTGQSVPPESALMILVRDLGCFSDFWRGWTIQGEDLISPDGWCVNRGDALSVPLKEAQISALRHKIRGLEADRNGGLEDQPEPGDIPVIRTG